MATLKRKSDDAAHSDKAAEAKKPKANGSIASFFVAVPKPAASASASASATAGDADGDKDAAAGASAPAPAAVKFDKQKWVGGLTAEQRKLLRLEIDTLDESWLAHLKDDITSKEFQELKRFLDRETSAGKKWFPPEEDVYSWSRHTPFHNVKVVIVGQDPYHNNNQAHGLAFSVRPPTPAPPSLKNMYIALKKDYPTFVPPPNRGGLLTPWADRGVLMLNTCLTVRAHDANSHSNRGWERFTQRVIDLVAQKRTRGVVFMAWGTPAGKRVQKIDKQKHLVLQSVHPSPLSASRGFYDCGHFKKANAWLIKRYGPDGEIDWALSPGSSTKAAPSPAAAAVGAAAAETAVEMASTSAAQTRGSTPEPAMEKKPVELGEDVDSEDEAALEEALRLAGGKAKEE
ncbi:hypothetical protein E4U41_000249 [Claviceps citrina]|nr:hypothetical protein E4U41_000249 [Claviceps citrina]